MFKKGGLPASYNKKRLQGLYFSTRGYNVGIANLIRMWLFPWIHKVIYLQSVQRSQIFRVSLRSHSLVIKRVRSHFRSQFLKGVHSHSSLPKIFRQKFFSIHIYTWTKLLKKISEKNIDKILKKICTRKNIRKDSIYCFFNIFFFIF